MHGTLVSCRGSKGVSPFPENVTRAEWVGRTTYTVNLTVRTKSVGKRIPTLHVMGCIIGHREGNDACLIEDMSQMRSSMDVQESRGVRGLSLFYPAYRVTRAALPGAADVISGHTWE